MPKKHKRSKDEKRSLIRHRGLLFRVLGYCLPHKRAIFLAAFFSFLSSFFGAFSILPFIPVINHVINPELTPGAVSVEEQADDPVVAEDPADGTRTPAGLPADARAEQIADAGVEAVEDLTSRFPLVTSVRNWGEERYEAVKEKIFGFLRARGSSAVKYIILIIIGVAILKSLFDYQTKYQMVKVVYKSIRTLKVELYTACLDLDFTALQHRTSGNLIARLSADVTRVRDILQTVSVQSVTVPFQVLCLFVVMLILNVKVTLVTMVALPVILIPILMLGKVLRGLSKRDAEEDARLVDVMQETLQGMPIVKAYNKEKDEQRRFSDVAQAQLRRQIRRHRIALAAPAVTEVLTTAAIGAVILAGAYIVLERQEMSPGTFIAYLIILMQFYKPMKGLTSGFVRVQRALASAERVFEIIDARPMVQESPDAQPLAPIEREIAFDRVSFSYSVETREKVLDEFTLTVPRGKCYALVGPSGSGKTTVTRLIPRFYDPVDGAVRIDGTDLRDVTFKSLRDQIAIVTQETILFDDTIRNNIAYGRAQASNEEILAAAQAANAHSFIENLPDGYETRLGERGGQLSGGQRQRIAIARAILRDCPILILDEATSALDSESEGLVQQALERLMENRTTIVIAHRLATVRHADRICVMENGRIVQQGTHEELLAAGGRYANLCRTELSAPRRSFSYAPQQEGPGESPVLPSSPPLSPSPDPAG